MPGVRAAAALLLLLAAAGASAGPMLEKYAAELQACGLESPHGAAMGELTACGVKIGHARRLLTELEQEPPPPARQPQQQLSVAQLEQQIAQLKQQGQQKPQQGQQQQQKAPQSPPNAGLQQRAPSSNRIRGPARAKPCANKPCQNGAMCTNVRSKDGSKPYTCVCKDGWEGPDCATKQASIHLDASMIQKTEDGPLVTPMLRDGKPLEGFAETAPSFPMTSEHVLIELENTGDLALDFQTPVLITENKAVVSPALVGKGRKGGRLGAAKTEGADSAKLKRMSPKRKIEVDHHCLAPGKSSKVMMVVNFANNMNVTFGWTMTCEASAPKGLTVIMKDFDGGKVYEKGAVSPLFSATGKAHVTQTPHFFLNFFATLVCASRSADTDLRAQYTATTDQNTTSFIMFACDPSKVKSKGKVKKGCKNPIAMNAPKIRSDDREVASPIIVGRAAKGGMVDLATEVAVRHNCHGFGTVRVTLTLNFKSFNPVELTWVKSCGGGRPKGLVIQQGGADVVSDGMVKQEWQRGMPTGAYVIIGEVKICDF